MNDLFSRFKSFVSPFTSAFKKPTQNQTPIPGPFSSFSSGPKASPFNLGGGTPASPFNLGSSQPKASPFNLGQSRAPNMTPLPPNMSTPTGPVRAPAPSFTGTPAIPQIKFNTSGAMTGARIGSAFGPLAGLVGGAAGGFSSQIKDFAGNLPATPSIPGGGSAPSSTQAPTSAPGSTQTFTTPSGVQVDASGNIVGGSSPTGGSSTPTAPDIRSLADLTPDTPPETVRAVESAEKAVTDASKLSAEELSTQAEIDRLLESTNKAFQNTSDQAIPLEFITGQLKSIENRALNLAQPLEAKLARMQAKRGAALTASKFALERADKRADAEKPGEGFTLGAGQTRFDAQGNVIAAGAKDAKTQVVESAGRKVLIDSQTGDIIRDLGASKVGIGKLDTQLVEIDGQKQLINSQTGEIISNFGAGGPGGVSKQQQIINDELSDKIGLVDEILGLEGLNSRVGPDVLFGLSPGRVPIADRFGAGQKFAGKVKQLTNQAFIDKLIEAKAKGATFGALNQSEADSLREAATAINGWEIKKDGVGQGKWNIDEASFKEELNTIKAMALRSIERSGASTEGIGTRNPEDAKIGETFTFEGKKYKRLGDDQFEELN